MRDEVISQIRSWHAMYVVIRQNLQWYWKKLNRFGIFHQTMSTFQYIPETSHQINIIGIVRNESYE